MEIYMAIYLVYDHSGKYLMGDRFSWLMCEETG